MFTYVFQDPHQTWLTHIMAMMASHQYWGGWSCTHANIIRASFLALPTRVLRPCVWHVNWKTLAKWIIIASWNHFHVTTCVLYIIFQQLINRFINILLSTWVKSSHCSLCCHCLGLECCVHECNVPWLNSWKSSKQIPINLQQVRPARRGLAWARAPLQNIGKSIRKDVVYSRSVVPRVWCSKYDTLWCVQICVTNVASCVVAWCTITTL